MRHGYAVAVALTALAAAMGCGGGGDGGGGPSPTVATVAVSAGGTGALASFGETRGLTAVARDAAGNAIPNAALAWNASPSGVVSLNATSGGAVTATALTNGSATVTVTSGAVSGAATIDVAQRLQSVAATPNPVGVSPGATRQLAAVARDARENVIAGATAFTYVSANQAVATVNANGLVAGVATGATTVTVSLTRDGASASLAVPVTVAPPPASATVAATTTNVFNPVTVEVAVGGAVTWTFASAHTVVFTGANAPEDIGERSSGSVARTFPAAGTFNYTCTIHAGMNGQVVVR